MRKQAHLGLDGEQCTARQYQRNVHRDNTELATRCNVNSVSDSLEGKGIRRDTNTFLKDRNQFANSMVQPSALRTYMHEMVPQPWRKGCPQMFNNLSVTRYDLHYRSSLLELYIHITFCSTPLVGRVAV